MKAAPVGAQDAIRQAGAVESIEGRTGHDRVDSNYLPNVYKMGYGQAGWGTAIYLTLYMTVLSFSSSEVLGVGSRSFPCLRKARRCLGK